MFTMSSAAVAIVFLCFVSIGCSAPLACEDLVRSLDQVDLQHLEGGWALVAGSLGEPSYVERFKQRDSAKINFSNATKSSDILLSRMFGFGEQCKYYPSNITLEGSSFSSKNITVTFVQTSCPDCLLMRFDDSGTIRNVYLFSRRREVEEKEMEEFKKQAECLKLLPPVMMDPTKELCPDQPPNGDSSN